MEIFVVKNEENPVRRRRMQDREAQETIPVKRRRRDISGENVKEYGTNSAPATVKRSSRFRGVSKHRWTGRYEAHLWDKLSWNVTQKKKGKQVYLGAFDDEEAAARAYDLASLKYWGTSTFTNFPITDYEKEIEIMQTTTKEEYLVSLRRKSSGFARGVSKYRGVARHHHNGRWEARIGRVFVNKHLYLGTYGTQEEAARAYDIAAVEYRGTNAVTNFDLSSYIPWLKPDSNTPFPAQETKPSAVSQQTISSSQPVTKSSIKQEKYEMNVPLNNCRRKPSSPTALGLLLRSPMFRELLEKSSSSSMSEEERSVIHEASSDDEYGGSVCDVLSVFSSNRHGKLLQEQICHSSSDMFGIGTVGVGAVSADHHI